MAAERGLPTLSITLYLTKDVYLSKMLSHEYQETEGSEPINKGRYGNCRPSICLPRRKGSGGVHRAAAMGRQAVLSAVRRFRGLSDEGQQDRRTPSQFPVALSRLQRAIHRA